MVQPNLFEPAPAPRTAIDFPTAVSSDILAKEYEALERELRNANLDVYEWRVVFAEPASLRGYKTAKKEISTALFVGNNTGGLCYRHNNWRRGYQLPASKVLRIEAIPPKQLVDEAVNAILKLVKRVHPNAWDDLKAKVAANPGKYAAEGYSVVSIASKFPEYVIDALKEAFENKTSYSYRRPAAGPSGRSLSVSTKLCDDGIFRAWFSSEFSGCANGDYWALINPVTAAFRERD